MKHTVSIRKMAAAMALFGIMSISFVGCGTKRNSFVSEASSVSINWESIISEIDNEQLAEYGWYADMETIAEDAEEFGVISFCNYDVTDQNAFLNVKYQLLIDYGIDDSYSEPVYSILLSDNNSNQYYSSIHAEDFSLLSEEGAWFFSDDKDTYLTDCLEKCSAILGFSEGE